MSHCETNLRAGTLGLPSVIMQAVTHIAPGTGIIFTLQLITKHAGQTVPLAFAIGFVMMLALGMSLAELAKHIPSAGGYYTYVSRTVHPRAGFLTAWLYFLYDPVGTAINLTFVGFIVENSLREAHLNCPWWAFMIVTALLISFLAYRGIEISVEFTMVLGIAEVLLLLALAASGLLAPGPGGVSLEPFNWHNIPSTSGLALAVVYTIFCFSGFEAVAPLAEESRNPKRNLPRAIVGSVLLMGLAYVFCSWGLLAGWGTDSETLQKFVNIPDNAENPVFQLARHLWGGGWIVILLVLVNSAIGVSMASTNAATRVFFAMARSGSLPKILARVHPVHQTPFVAIALQTVLTFAIGLGLGFAMGPEGEFFFLATALTVGMVFVYCAGNLGVFLFFYRKLRSEFSVFRHFLLPLVSTAVMLYGGYKTLDPAPDPFPPPACYAPYLVLIWLAIGIGLLMLMKMRGREEWLLKAGQAAYEGPEPDQTGGAATSSLPTS